jgi:hypothetical protein
MILVLQIGAALVAGAALAAAAAGRGTRMTLAGALAVLAISLGYLAFGSRVWQAGKLFADQRGAWEHVTPYEASVAGAPPSVDRSFADWIDARLRPGDSFFIAPPAGSDPGVLQWFTFRLLPHLAAEDAAHANVLIFYGTNPRKSGLSGRVAGVAEQYGPGLSIARTRNAS